MKSKRKETSSFISKLRDRWMIIVIGVLILYFPFLFLKNELKAHLLNNNSTQVVAVIVDEKNYWGNSPVKQVFSYSYEFVVDGKKYREDSRNKDLTVGDSILIKYANVYPRFSRIVKNTI